MPAGVELGLGMEYIDSFHCSNSDSKMVVWCWRLVSGQGHGVGSGPAAATGWKQAAAVKEQNNL
jgi:hypothetical protein